MKYNVMTVAYELRRPLQEVLEYSPQELAYWLAFFKLRAQRLEEEAQKRAKKSKPRVTTRRR